MIHAIYLIAGWLVAWRALPNGRNSLMVILLWPWPVAAHLVYIFRGKYPRWTPPL